MQELQALISAQNVHVPIWGFVLNLILTIFLSWILGTTYQHFGRTLSNRKAFSANFIFLSVTTMVVITIVKSSLALSLGLVGALSIVRFRTAIKDPEELNYLFMCIAIGLGMGANQRITTCVALGIVILIIVTRKSLKFKKDGHNMHLIINLPKKGKSDVQTIVEKLEPFCNLLHLKRIDENSDTLEAVFMIEFENFDQFNNAKKALNELGSVKKLTFLDNQGLIQDANL